MVRTFTVMPTTWRKFPVILFGLAVATALTFALAGANVSRARMLAGDTCDHRAPQVRSPRASSLRVGTYNIRAGVSVTRFAEGVKALLPYVDIAGLQEVNSKEKARELHNLESRGWHFWRQYRTHIPQHPQSGGAEQVPVVWRADRFVCTYAGPFLASDIHDMKGELPTWDADQRQRHWFTVIHLVDRVTGQRLSIINVHVIHGAVTGGRPAPGRARHWHVYVDQLTNLIAKVKKERAYGRVLVTGDFNAGWVADEAHRHRDLPFRTFRAIEFKSMWATERPKGAKGTHGAALIDQVYGREEAASAEVLFGIDAYSDHLPAVARYDIPSVS